MLTNSCRRIARSQVASSSSRASFSSLLPDEDHRSRSLPLRIPSLKAKAKPGNNHEVRSEFLSRLMASLLKSQDGEAAAGGSAPESTTTTKPTGGHAPSGLAKASSSTMKPPPPGGPVPKLQKLKGRGTVEVVGKQKKTHDVPNKDHKKGRKAKRASQKPVEHQTGPSQLEPDIRTMVARSMNRKQGSHLSTGFVEENWKSPEWQELKVTKSLEGRSLGTGFTEEQGSRKRKKKRTTKHDPPPHGAITEYEVEGILSPSEETLADVEPTHPCPPIATLSHGLDRVLFNPGVHWVQDPRSKVYNFTPWVETVPKVSDFDFGRLPGFVPSSRDRELRELAEREGKRFCGSTSSLSGILSQCYFLIGETKEVDTSCLSQAFKNLPRTFSPGQRWPASVVLNHKDGIYCIDSDKSKVDFPEKTILTWLGTLLEKFLTSQPDTFRKYLKAYPGDNKTNDQLEAYRYSKSREFIMRSQLDCYDPRLPGTGVFDIKTRACVATRLDILNYEEHAGYTIRSQHGPIESFEKEYYDLIRSAFLKYSFQVRIGDMDGVIVAYHNTGKIFGFQYISLAEMDQCLYGSTEEGVGDRVFDKCVGLMEKVMSEAIKCFPGQSIKATFETKEDTKGMSVWIEPAEWEGPESIRPIEQMRVEVTSYLGNDPVRGIRAAVSNEAAWTLRYKIQKLVMTPETKRENLESARARQNPAFLIPSHVTEGELEEYWRTLNHGDKKADREATKFDSDLFMHPPTSIQKLRVISRKGKEDTERELELYGDQPKVVWDAGSSL